MMRPLLTRRHIGVCGIGLLAAALPVVAATQISWGSGGPAAADLAVLRHAALAASTPVAAPPPPTATPSASASASPASTPTPSATATATPMAVVTAVPSVPAPDPTAVPPSSARPTYSQADIEAILTAAAQADGVSPSWLISTAQCESNLNAYAYNPGGPYDGILQFLPSTFAAHGGTDIWDPAQQAQIAASMFASGESGEWPVCSRQ